MENPSFFIYASIECPYAYLATFRLRQLRSEWQGRLRLVWKALSLEYINRGSYAKPLYEAEHGLFRQLEPALPWRLWDGPDWSWPTTFWPAFEALACAQAQGDQPAFEMSWALRHAYFAECRDISMRHVLHDIARDLSKDGLLDYSRFVDDWDSGRQKRAVLEDSRQGWRELKLDGSATLVNPSGERATNPAVGEIDFDEEAAVLRSYIPYPGDPLQAYRLLLGL
jgi:predicted DsbA family dithiol-disulfide isomerase